MKKSGQSTLGVANLSLMTMRYAEKHLTRIFCLPVLLFFCPPVFGQSADDQVFREAFPQCFKVFADGQSSENLACREVLVRNPYTKYSDDDLAKVVQEIVHPPKAPTEEDILKAKYPHCFSLYKADTPERTICLEVLSRYALNSWSEESVREDVRLEIARREAEKVDADKRRKQRERELAKRNAELSRKPLGWVVERWQLGGFGNVLIATVTIQNNSKSRLSDFRVACTTYGNSGTGLSSVASVLYEALRPGDRDTYDVNLGLVHPQSARANCTVFAR